MREIIDNLRKETEATLRVLYALKQFRLFISRQDDVDKINTNVEFWRIFETSVRTNLFIGIRRLYENNSTTFNFQKVIKNCIENIDSFSADSLRERKMAGSSNANEWIDAYMENIHEANTDDFKQLGKVVRDNSKRMKGIYTEAASKIYAHAIHMNYASMSEVTDQLSFDEMETALESIWHCYNQIWQMHENGRKPTFDVEKYPYEQEVCDSLIKQLRVASA